MSSMNLFPAAVSVGDETTNVLLYNQTIEKAGTPEWKGSFIESIACLQNRKSHFVIAITMGFGSYTSHSSTTVAAALTALLLGMLNSFPAALLLLGSGSLLPIRDGNNVAFAFSGSLPKHPRAMLQTKWNGNGNEIRLDARLENTPEGNEERKIQRELDVFPFANHHNRRRFFRDATVSSAAALSASSSNPRVASAGNPKSRTEGYQVQRSEREWAYVLSGPQYNILRRGGTERQKSSILNTFTSDNVGTYVCAACPTALFVSKDKFSSGTGWPSFARALEGVEEEQMNPISATLGGKEVRCGTCGGHLGDLFNDGWVYVGTSAFETGNRYCIDGAALVFKPADGGAEIFGDVPPPNKVIDYEPAIFRDKSVNSNNNRL